MSSQTSFNSINCSDSAIFVVVYWMRKIKALLFDLFVELYQPSIQILESPSSLTNRITFDPVIKTSQRTRLLKFHNKSGRLYSVQLASIQELVKLEPEEWPFVGRWYVLEAMFNRSVLKDRSLGWQVRQLRTILLSVDSIINRPEDCTNQLDKFGAYSAQACTY